MIKPISLIILVSLAIGVWIGFRPAGAADGEAIKGRPLYERFCLSCHGPEGRGDGPLGLHLNPPAANFHKPESRNKSDDDLLSAIRQGHSETAMAAWKGMLTEKELRDVLSYIRKLAGGPSRDSTG
jgi:mono/diheme cytochrome c family protein